MTTEGRPEDFSAALLSEHPPADSHPAELYLAGRAPQSRDRARATLNTMAALLTAGHGTAHTLAWHLLRDVHVEELRAALAARHQAAAARRMLAALRGVLTQCWRLGLLPAEEYHRAHAAAAAGGHAASRGELRSVLESCVEDEPPALERGDAVRALLYGNGMRDSKALPVPSAGRSALSMEQLRLRRVTPRDAIAHALWEAGVCIRSSAFCAGLAMLRKALDLWSADYRERHGIDGDRGGSEPGDLRRRLTKIAEENKLYREAIYTIVESVDHDAGGPAMGIVCRAGVAGGYDGHAVARTKETYRNLHELVVTLITATTADLPL